MKKKVLTFVVACALILTVTSINICALIPENENTNSEYSYLQCDYETREISTYRAPVENSVTETWNLMDASTVQSMKQLTETFFNENAQNSSRTILGDDDRYVSLPEVAPYCSVAVLISRFDTDGDGVVDFTARGTGFLVSKNVLVTAAHCVVPKDMSTSKLMELRIYFDVFSDSLSGYSYEHPKKWAWTQNWHDSTTGWMYDYCVVELHNDISRPYYFNCVSSSNIATPQTVYATGYPGDKQYYQMTSRGQLTESAYNYCHFNNDIMPGMSGGPLYYGNSCFGIITYSSDTFNQGNLITPYLYNLICSKISDNQ